MKHKLKQLWYWLITPYRNYVAHKEFKKHLEELRKKDPFIYK